MVSFFNPLRLEQQSIHDALHQAQEFFEGMLLDLGCGEQPYLSLIQAKSRRYVGVDHNTSYKKPPDVCADSLRLPFKDNTFDTVLSTQVIEHVTSPFEMIREAVRILKPGGHLVLTAPQVWPLHEEPNDYFRYTKYGLAALAEASNLKVVYIRERGGGIIAIGQLIGTILHDKFGKHLITRLPMKLILAPCLWLCKLADRLSYYPKLTLGYIMVARKSGALGNYE